jgi:L-ribulose-5-phosphate 3-epimerase
MLNDSSLLNRLAVCSWSLQPKSSDELVSMVRSLGLSKVQLALNEHRGSAGGAAIASQLAAAGIQIVSGMFGTIGEDYNSLESIRRTGGVIPDDTWEANLALARETVETARCLELDLVTFHAGFLPEDSSDPNYGKLLGRLRTLAEMFASAGITLAFETGQEDAEILLRFLDDLAAPNVGVNFDPANMILYAKGDPVAGMRTLLPYLKQVHIKDAIATTEPGTWGSEVVVGTGQVDWPAFLGLLDEAGYSGALCIEREAGENRVAEILAAKRHVESILEKGMQS